MAYATFFTVHNEFQLVLLLLDSLFSWWPIFYFFNYTVEDSVSWLKSDYIWWIRESGCQNCICQFQGILFLYYGPHCLNLYPEFTLQLLIYFVYRHCHIYMTAHKCSRLVRFVSQIFASWSLLFCKRCSLFIAWLI